MDLIFSTLTETSGTASFLILGVLLARFLLKNSPKYIRKILWLLVGLRLIFPFSVESTFSILPTKKEIETISEQLPIQEITATPVNDVNIFPYIWLAVTMLLILYGLISFIRLKVKISDAVLYKDNIYQSEKISSPFVFGIFKPKIYVLYNMDENTLDCVIRHEKQHIAHKDYIVKIIGYVLLAVYWFNPLAWLSYILFCKDIELCCDENVIRNTDKQFHKEYASALLALGTDKVRLAACPLAFGEVSIKLRIKSVIKYKKTNIFVLCLSVLLCGVIAICLMTNPKAATIPTPEENTAPPTETVTEQVTEPVTEPHTEPVTEPHTEPVTEPSTESVTEETPTEAVQEQVAYTRVYTEPDTTTEETSNVEFTIIPLETFTHFEPYTQPYYNRVTKPQGPAGNIPMPEIPPLFGPEPY